MKKTIITTVGTSLFGNFLKKNKGMEYTIKILSKTLLHEWDKKSNYIDRLRKQVTPFALHNKFASAEIESSIRIQQELKEEILVHLIVTDTVLSRLAAEIIKEALPTLGVQVEFEFSADRIHGLQVKDKKRFEKEGVIHLIERIYDITGGYFEYTCLNATGGYKALISYLNLIGQVNNIPVYCLFENDEDDIERNDLIQIPQTPINIDWGLFEKYSHIFSELKNGINKSWEQYRRENNIQEDFPPCIEEIEDAGEYLIGLNAVGNIFWERYVNFFVAYFPIGGKYFNENREKKKEINDAIRELYRRISNAPEELDVLKDVDIKHTVIEDTYVYKHSNPNQIRIQYQRTKDGLKILNYFFIHSTQIDKEYSTLMKKEYSTIKMQDFIPIALKLKKEV